MVIYVSENYQSDEYMTQALRNNEAKSIILSKIICPVPVSTQGTDIDLRYLKSQLKRYDEDYGLDLNPDFQRGHVWTMEQKIAYMESFIRGSVDMTGRTITFNCPDFGRNVQANNSDLEGMVCIDGLQRLSAVIDFMDDKFKVFKNNFHGIDVGDGLSKNSLDNTPYSLRNKCMRFQFFSMQYKRDVLDYYIAFNSGGTIHSKEEIDRVKQMRNSL